VKRRLPKWLLKAIVVPVLALLCLEAGLRIADYGYPTSFTIPCTVNGEAADCNNDHYTWQFFPKGAFRLAPAFAIPTEKKASTVRIFVVGESAALGDPEPAYGFARYLEVMLRERFPDKRFEIINISTTAVNSHVLLPAVRDLAARSGDLFLFYMGNNEVVGPFGPENPSATRANIALIRLGIFLRSTRIWQLLSASTSKPTAPAEWRGMDSFLAKQVPADAPSLSSVYANFEQNLKDAIAAARGSGARVIVSTVAVNLKDSPPFASLHRAGLTDRDARAWDSLVSDDTTQESHGECADALRKYSAAAAIDDRHAELNFRIGRCELALGHSASARERFETARDLDSLRFRIDGKTNDIIRSVTKSAGPGVDLLDTEKLFGEISPSGPGKEMFYDHVHLNPRGSYELARAFYQLIVPALADSTSGGSKPMEPPSEEECNALLAFTDYDRGRILRTVVDELGQPPFAGQFDHKERIGELEHEADSLQENPVATATAYRAAIAKAPDDHFLHLLYAKFLDPYEPGAAAYEYRKALSLLPTDFGARGKLAAALARSGKYSEAIEECRTLLRSVPYDVPAHLTMAYALARLENYDESIEAYRQAMALHPEMSIEAYNEIGIIETLQGKYAEAADTFQKAIALDVKNAKTSELEKNLAFALSKRDAQAAHQDTTKQ
jgi:tetratricopeptide (TPR) repeat protein